eukprot:jgi/Ulvmu1/9755/UM055_0095.1
MGRLCGIIPFGGVTGSRLFRKLALKTFSQCDKDGDGTLDEKELHICLLLLYDKLNDKLPCHVRVPTSDEVHKLFLAHASAHGQSLAEASLTEEQFVELAAALMGADRRWWDSVVAKVALSVGLQMALFPLAGHGLTRLSKAMGVPLVQRLSPAIWAYGTEKAYKVLRMAAPELP